MRKRYGDNHYKQHITKFSKETGIVLTKKGLLDITVTDHLLETDDPTEDHGASQYILVSKKFALLKKPVNPSRFRTHPAVPELSALCIILAVFLKGGKNVSADSA